MKLDKIISNISAVVAGVIVFLFTAGMYLSVKGFEFLPDGKIVLVKAAQASENMSKTISADIVLPKGHIMGDVNAPASIYEFSSLNCYHCAKFHLNELPKIKKEFIDTKKANLVFVNFPLDARSMQGALIADCMPNNKYFAYINKVFQNQKKWGRSSETTKYLTQYAMEEGLSKETINKCMRNEATANIIIADRQDAMDKLKIMGTPSFLVVKGKDRFLFEGMPSIENLSKILNKN